MFLQVMNARMEMLQKRKQRLSSQIMAALNESLSEKLKSKDEETDQLMKLIWKMNDRIKSLSLESDAWRCLAQTQRASAAKLRAKFEQLQANQAVVPDDAESCCGDNFEPTVLTPREAMRICRNCGNAEQSVVLMPCRHMCLCWACGLKTDACPICKCRKTGSVNVNLR